MSVTSPLNNFSSVNAETPGKRDFSLVPGLQAIEMAKVTLASDAGEVAADDTRGEVVFSDTDSADAANGGFKSLKQAGFDGSAWQTLVVPGEGGEVTVLLGAGQKVDLEPDALRNLAAAFVRAVPRETKLALVLPKNVAVSNDGFTALAEGALLARYRYTEFQSDQVKKGNGAADLETFTVVAGQDLDADAAASANGALQKGFAAARATIVARDITNAPPAHMTPKALAAVAEELGAQFGFEVEVLKKRDLKELGCGGILGVNRGSKRGPRLIRLRYVPEAGSASEDANATEDSDAKRLALVGKGITFDSGGLSLKPSDSMLEMKMDLGGAAAVLGAFTAMRDFGVNVEVEGWLPSTDNMISGDSVRLGEVLVARNGVTVEVQNTDAEGRLILMDALALAAETKPTWMVDIATLTGGAKVALGDSIAALFGSNPALVKSIEAAADETGEPVWELPLEKSYTKKLDSKVADLTNTGGRWASAVTAALFLSHFVDETPWAHIDIAGPMSTDKNELWKAAGATGFGARLLLRLASDLNSEI